jgi:glycosyltransferase involved in cell wall biosynthesis
MNVLSLARQALPYLRRRIVDHLRTHHCGRRKKRRGFSSYTVITAVYNAEQYLEDYFRSLENQLLDFSANIRLILVDDGSTDDSAAIIRRHQQRYPNNITYLRTENQGQGAARNMGLPLVTSPWVTFIDADDFVDCAYFREVDALLEAYDAQRGPDDQVAMILCNRLVYYEHSRRFFNKHRLRRRFEGPCRVFPHSRIDDLIAENVAMSFFSSARMQRQGLRFDERRWPRFEDGHLALRYLMGLDGGDIVLLPSARYYYRKRADKSSSMDTSTEKKAYYLDMLQEGFLELFALAETTFGRVPRFVQRNILYSLGSRLEDLLDAPRPAVLSAEENRYFLDLCRRCLTFIDDRTFLGFPEDWLQLDAIQKRALLSFFKNSEELPRLVQVHAFDGDTLDLTYYCRDIPSECVLLDNARSEATASQTGPALFSGEHCCQRRELRLKDLRHTATVQLLLDDQPVTFLFAGNAFPEELPLGVLEDALI